MLSRLNNNSVYRIIISSLWFLLLVGLPLTSFPILSRLTGAIVAPFSAIPLFFLIILWLIPYLLDGRGFPAEVIPFIYFILCALIITSLAFFLNGYYDLGRNYFDQSLRALFTVAIGLAFYMFFTVFPLSEKTIQKTLLFISIGGGILIIWTIIESILLRGVNRAIRLPESFLTIRSALAVYSPSMMFTNRVTGFAYEPSWFVRQFNLILFPIWLALAFFRKSVFPVKVWLFQIEDFLIVAGLIVFGFSSPRIGSVALLVSLTFLAFLFLLQVHKYLTTWYVRWRKIPSSRLIIAKIILAIVMIVVILMIFLGTMNWYIGFASQWDWRFELMARQSPSNLLQVFSLSETDLIYRARDLAFYERVIFWFGGWNIFNDFPFGVGLGNAGFYFLERMHGAGFESFEIRNIIYRANYLPNTKNLWTRLLAETGFIGLALFAVWLYFLWRSAGLSRKHGTGLLKVIGLAGQLFLLAFIIEALSMDSFAMPYEWIMAGLISAAGVLTRKNLRSRDMPQGLVTDQA